MVRLVNNSYANPLMTHTAYSRRNIVLLLTGAVLCLLNTTFVALTAGFATDPVHDSHTLSAAILLYVSLLSVPAYLALWRWSGIAARAMWTLSGCSLVLILIGASHYLVFLVPLVLLSILAESVHTESRVMTGGS